MLSIANKNVDVNASYRVNTVSYEEARSWIGRSLMLQKSLLNFSPGMQCIVMCVVDFGEGPLLWIVTDDKQSIDVDQLEVSYVSEYFRLLEADTLQQTA